MRREIVHAASRRFRGRGGESVAITELMRDLELTHGGFYRHFAGKEELFREALIEGLRESEAKLNAAVEGAPVGRELEAIIHTYLSLEHCANAARGCPIAALATEIARHPRKTRSRFFRALQSHAPTVARFLPGRTLAERRRTALVLFAGMAGVLNLARATPDRSSRRTILESARAFYIRTLCPPARPSARRAASIR